MCERDNVFLFCKRHLINLVLTSFLIITCFLPQRSCAQAIPADSVKPVFSKAALRLALTEIAPFVYDRYGKQAAYARISLGSLAHNINPRSWTWDQDPFLTNQIGHPFHGSQFFNSFRTGGYRFWQSVPATFAGSYIWETFGENEPPSINDFINTGFGGVMLGELMHRLSEKIHHSRRSGWIKEPAKIAALILNPVDGFRRITDKTWNRPEKSNDPEIPMVTEADIGFRKFSPNHTNPFTNGRFGMYGRLRFIYGDPLKNRKTPFSYITLLAEFGEDDSSGLNIISLRGQLAAWKLRGTKKMQVANITADYDYLRNEVFFYSAESLKINLQSDLVQTHSLSISTALGAGPVILAAIPNDSTYHSRNYDYGPGFSFYGSARIQCTQIFSITPRYSGGWMITANGSGSHYYLHMFKTEMTIATGKKIFISVESGHFSLYSHYGNDGNTRKIYPYLRASVRFLPF